jgi:UDP-glucose 4-epimerase
VRVLVTGGYGFLGRAVVDDLAGRGWDVVVLSRRAGEAGRESVRVDLLSRNKASIVGALRVDAVVHLAALTSVRQSFADPLGYFEANVSGTANLLRGLGQRRVPIVFASTHAVYGSEYEGALSEELPVRPASPYAASKVAAEQLLAWQAKTGAIGSTVLRCFNIAGPGDPDTSRIIPACLRAAAGEIEHVSVNGDGSAVRDFVHVADVAEAVRLALESTVLGQHRVFNVGTGEGASMAEVVAAAEKVTGRTIPVEHRPPAQEAHTVVAQVTLARDVLGWEPSRSRVEEILLDAWKAKVSPR